MAVRTESNDWVSRKKLVHSFQVQRRTSWPLISLTREVIPRHSDICIWLLENNYFYWEFCRLEPTWRCTSESMFSRMVYGSACITSKRYHSLKKPASCGSIGPVNLKILQITFTTKLVSQSVSLSVDQLVYN